MGLAQVRLQADIAEVTSLGETAVGGKRVRGVGGQLTSVDSVLNVLGSMRMHDVKKHRNLEAMALVDQALQGVRVTCRRGQ